MPFPPNTRLGRYEIRSHIGAGGMGDVLLASDTLLGRDVALKLLPPQSAEHNPSLDHSLRAALGRLHNHAPQY